MAAASQLRWNTITSTLACRNRPTQACGRQPRTLRDVPYQPIPGLAFRQCRIEEP